jgi:LPXTG-motif cell wall-anchored protein
VSALKTTLDVFYQVLVMPKSKLASMSDANLNFAINAAELAKTQNIPQASQVLGVLKAEQARRSSSNTLFTGISNTNLYLLGGAGLVAAWFFFIRK